ncbi:MAG: N-acetylglucosamine-6-phosphate deacetylase [Verrucomicrobia bacterium]|nr:MAG: N-acetylglucosamine-6-phosphate deacetylase [Verrucomicrobiota bacterium]TAE86297.1 MAG: N-acetylglucosamine-6-phosphate deacetylase [Verrucomicrobiota bacterium]TAF23696.1 MAG: N-acetylglucosamine-6-phosphate deacetylase [Verrucomicrobiota bacterium]TAF40262.1 MAG: N-acetylglucosamine-6-phosphate deacetylase [Verrucomicrobiota bacterium]
MRKLILNARVVSPGIDIPCAAVLLDGGHIVSVIEDGPLPAADCRIDAGGNCLLPGFIDIHSHGADGCDCSDASPKALRHIAAKKREEGVTTWLPTTLTASREELGGIAHRVADFRSQCGFIRCPGLHVEGPFINPEKAGAQNARFIRPPDVQEIAELNAIVPVKILSLAPELPGALEVIEACRRLGIVCSAAHSAATAAEIFKACDAGLGHLTHFGNAMSPLHHREIGMVGAGLLDDRLMLEFIPDGVHVSPDMLRLLFKVVPIERLMMVTDSTAASWRGDGGMRLGGLEVEIRNGLARVVGSGALAGSTLRANEGLRMLFQVIGRPLAELVQVTSWNQARSLGLGKLGRIEPGYLADLVLLDADFGVLRSFIGGEEL